MIRHVATAPKATDWVALLDADEALAAAGSTPRRGPRPVPRAWPACPGSIPGAWQPPDDLGGPGCLGLLVLEGFLVRHVDVVGRPATELLGKGDLLRPWEPDRTAPFFSDVRWQVLEPCLVALLDERVCAVIGRWPELVAAIVRTRARALARAGDRARRRPDTEHAPAAPRCAVAHRGAVGASRTRTAPSFRFA